MTERAVPMPAWCLMIGTLLCGALLAPTVALAADPRGLPPAGETQTRFGRQGQAAMSIEDLLDYDVATTKIPASDTQQPVPEHRVTTHGFSFSSPLPLRLSFGAHYFVLPSLSLGATLGLNSRTHIVVEQVCYQTCTPGRAAPTSTTVLVQFEPKVGYVLPVGDFAGFWVRGGVGVINESPHWLLSGDLLFYVFPMHRFGLYVGPKFDFIPSGSPASTSSGHSGTSLKTVTSDSPFADLAA